MHPLPPEMLRDIGIDHRNDLRHEMADRRLARMAQVEDGSPAADGVAERVDSGARRWLARVPAFGRRFARGF